MKTGASLWPQMPLQKGAMQALTVISGKISMLDIGKAMETIVQRQQNNVFKIMLKGETFIVKGLPASMPGREISVMAQRYGGKLELIWQAVPAANQQAGKEGEAKHTFRQAGEKVTISSRQSGDPVKAESHASRAVKLQIIRGNTHGLSPGHSYTATAIKAGDGRFNITLKGQRFTISGLPESMAGKTLTITTRQSAAPHGVKIEFEWVKTGKQQLTSGKLESGTRMGGKNTHSLRNAPAGENSKTQKAGQEKIHSNIPGNNKMPILQPGPQSIHQEAKNGMPQLKAGAGEVVMALVQKRLPNGNIRLNVAGASFESPAPPSIRHGDALMLRMTKGGELEVVQVHKDVNQKALSVLKSNLPASSPTAQSMSAIRSLLPTTAAGALPDIDALTQMETWLSAAGSSKEEPINGQRLAALIRDSGLNLEHKLMTLLQQGKADLPLQQDLKAILLQITELQPDKIHNASLARTLIELAQQGVSRIEAGQALNMLANIQNEPYRFEFPMLINQQITNVQLSFQQNDHSEQHESGGHGSSDQSYNVLFALELSQLGKLRVDANISDNAVYARIYNGSNDMQQFIQQHMHRLESRLHDLGYKEVYLNVSGIRPDSEKQARFEQLTTMTPATFSLLDIRI